MRHDARLAWSLLVSVLSLSIMGCAGRDPIALTSEQIDAGPTLHIGDPAPPIAIREWVRGEPVDAFEPGRVYVLDFWASWCGPCLASMSHMSELQEKHGPSVRVVGVTTEDRGNTPSRIRATARRMESEARFAIAIDEGDATAQRYRVGVCDNTLPRAFVVDGAGRLAWFGHPMDLDPVLDEILAGTWDLKAEAACKAKDQQATRAQRRLWDEYLAASDRNDRAGVLAACERACGYDVEGRKDSRAALWAWTVRVQTLVDEKRTEEAVAAAEIAMRTPGVADDASTLAVMAGSLAPVAPEVAQRPADAALKLITARESAPAADAWSRYMRDGSIMQDADARHRIASARAAAKRYREAVELQERVVEVWPDNAHLLPSRKQVTTALERYRKALAEQPS